ncbi:hypothetical protein [uncultured Brevundimonas sp.]|uniref:hypothetical protein n=1 Tax=uncultured Brevundimonas sp. TaxID=213418 RepID=UPI0030EE926E|tara:strand:- start:22289 stop:22717 length:429 start_codon:yes stop_codon:yes gene_type:complete
MPVTLIGQIGAVCLVLAVTFAMLKGDEPERIGGGSLALTWFASMLIQGAGNWNGTDWGLFALDLVLLAILCGLAWKSSRAWPAWACGLQLLVIMSHIMTLTDVRPPIEAFYIVFNMAGFGVMLALAIGTFWAWQDRRAAEMK